MTFWNYIEIAVLWLVLVVVIVLFFKGANPREGGE